VAKIAQEEKDKEAASIVNLTVLIIPTMAQEVIVHPVEMTYGEMPNCFARTDGFDESG
jgi:hypothetical protein